MFEGFLNLKMITKQPVKRFLSDKKKEYVKCFVILLLTLFISKITLVEIDSQ